ncbi:CBS domain-containing protein [Halobacterium zhouii]|uniref:CBS domain-containing protein n=1 Tax=Halobacterium zhouii TaxID=2902624 RepID=UPI001E4B2836|nr:CBS domain-containing protein [Halobacterium zhouii]
MRVEDVMTDVVVTVDADASLRTAAGRMVEERVGSLVVTADGDPAGILTETDFVSAGYEHDRPFSEVPVHAAMSRPLVTVGPAETVRAAARTMRDRGVKKLPVADELDLVGVVTTTDLVAVQDDLARETREHLDERETWAGK